uniref:Isoform 2 of Tropomodulin-2 n=1 Tax=Mus musculus TaxID=10090 RepID=Q9JKK7-2
MALPFQKGLEKYKNIDEDELLGKLSEEELKQLENVLDDLDPESATLPAGFRQKDQTQKAATGPFDREHLLMYLEKEALEQKDREDFVPFTGEKKGRVFIPKEKPVETRKEEKVTLDPELEEALASASDTELYDLAAVLGVHNLLNNPKFDEETTNGEGRKGPVRSKLTRALGAWEVPEPAWCMFHQAQCLVSASPSVVTQGTQSYRTHIRGTSSSGEKKSIPDKFAQSAQNANKVFCSKG